MALSHKIFTISDSSVTQVTVPAGQEIQYASTLTISIQNLSNENNVLLGDSSIALNSYGFKIEPGQIFAATLSSSNDLYALCDSGTADVAVIWVQA